MLYYVILYSIILYYIISYHVISYHIILYYIIDIPIYIYTDVQVYRFRTSNSCKDATPLIEATQVFYCLS